MFMPQVVGANLLLLCYFPGSLLICLSPVSIRSASEHIHRALGTVWDYD